MTAQPTPLRDRTLRAQDLSVHLQRIRAEERASLAQELHDELGALLLAAKLNVAGLKARCLPSNTDVALRFDHLVQLLDEGLALKTRVVDGLRPSKVLDLGLQDALAQLIMEFQRDTGLAVQVQLEGLDLDATTQMSVYRFVQECLTNIGKHAHATSVSINACKVRHEHFVSIADNGVGFARTGFASSAHGLMGMRRRIEALGGRLVIESGATQGARVTAVIPRRGSVSRSARTRPLPRVKRAGPSLASGAMRWSTMHRLCARAKPSGS